MYGFIYKITNPLNSLTLAANALDLLPEQIKRYCTGKQRKQAVSIGNLQTTIE